MNIEAKNHLESWIQSVSEQNLKSTLSLYSDNAILLGTFASKEYIGSVEIKKYFIDFFKKQPKASFISMYCNEMTNNSCVFNGYYSFKVIDGSEVIARYTFVLQNIGVWKIIAHHSSVQP